MRPRFSNVVIKSHLLHEAARDLCASGALKTIYTWRDPYDVIASALQMFGHNVNHWAEVLRNALRVWSFHLSTGAGHIVAYDSMITAPVDTISGIATYLELSPSHQQVRQLAERMSIRNLKKFTHRVCDLEQSRVVRKEGYTFDRHTLLHQGHIRDGRTGYGILALNARQRARIDAVLVEEGFPFLCRALRDDPESETSSVGAVGAGSRSTTVSYADRTTCVTV